MSESRAHIQAVFGQIIRDPALRDRVAAEPDATLQALGLAQVDRVGMLGAGVERLLAYHEMVHDRVQQTVRTFIGPAAPLLGDARLRHDIDGWIASPGPKSPYLRELPAEFLAWVRPRWDDDAALPPWLGELAAHQVMIRAIRNDPRPIGHARDSKLELDRPIVCNGTTRVLRYRWAVHRLGRQVAASDAVEHMPEGHAVIGYRDSGGVPRFVDSKPRSAHMLERLLAGQSLRDALLGACAAMAEQLDDEILSITAVTLADLVDRGVLLGS
jgi:hypothetical protein